MPGSDDEFRLPVTVFPQAGKFPTPLSEREVHAGSGGEMAGPELRATAEGERCVGEPARVKSRRPISARERTLSLEREIDPSRSR